MKSNYSTVLPIHRHTGSSETCIVLRGKAEKIIYDDNGFDTVRVVMLPDIYSNNVNIAMRRWHKIIPLVSGAVRFEAKDRVYEPFSAEDIRNL